MLCTASSLALEYTKMFLDQINKKLAALQSEQSKMPTLKLANNAAKTKSKIVGVKATRPLGAHSIAKMVVEEEESSQEALIEVDAYVIPDYGPIESESTPVLYTPAFPEPEPVLYTPAFPEPEPTPEPIPEVTKPEPTPNPEPPKPKPKPKAKAKTEPLPKGDFRTTGVALPLDLHTEMTAFLYANKAEYHALKLLALECIKRGFAELKKDR